jgi:hypothetical protein
LNLRPADYKSAALPTELIQHKKVILNWLRKLDLNQRPSGYEPDELPCCSIPR